MEKTFQLILSVLSLLIPQLRKSDSKEGIKESKEMLIGLNELSILLVMKFRDGVQFSDFTEMHSELQNDDEFKAKLEAAYANYQLIPSEVKDVDAGEGLELASVQLEYIPKILSGLKK